MSKWLRGVFARTLAVSGWVAHRWWRGRLVAAGLISFGVCLIGQDANAQQTADATAATAPNVGEIVVTAMKRDEKVRDVAEAVTVISGADLAAVGPIRDTSDLLNAVPGARFNNLANPLQSEISIRGSGTERGTGADSSVGLYANGVYVGSGGDGGRDLAPIDSFDLNHLEVLEGPQGALYGRDAEYGVVNAVAQEPTFSNSGKVDDIYTANIEQNNLSAIVNYKLNDHWAVRFGVQDYDQAGGFEYNPDNHTYYDRMNGYMVRGQVRYQNDNLDVNLMYERQQLQVPSFWSADQIAPRNAVTGYPGIATEPLGFVQNPRVIPHNGNDFSEEDINNVVLSVNYDFGWAKITSTSSWRTFYTNDQVDSDYIDVATEINLQNLGESGSYPFSQINRVANTTTWYEDIHLAGAPILHNRLTWLVGVELLSQPTDLSASQTGNPCASINAPNIRLGQAACGGTPSAPTCTQILPGSTCPAVVSPYGSLGISSGTYESYAPYASLSYKVGWGFTLGGEVRYSNDHKTAQGSVSELYTNGTPYPYLTGGTIQPESLSLESGNVTYTATLSYKIPGRWDDTLYTKIGTGYRVGGFNLTHSPPLLTPPYPKGISAVVNYAPVVPTYGDETSTSYEIGFKGEIARRAYFTLDTYWQTTNGALAAVGDGCTPVNACLTGNTNYTVNGGTVRGSGVEVQFDTNLDLLGGLLTVQLDGSNQYAKYVSNPTSGPNGEALLGLPLIGTPIAQNPRYLANATVNYRHALIANAEGFLNLEYHGQWGGIENPETVAGVYPTFLANYQNIDLRTGVDWKAFELALIIDNLTNETYQLIDFMQNGVNTVTHLPVAVQVQQRLNLPRSYAVELSYKW